MLEGEAQLRRSIANMEAKIQELTKKDKFQCQQAIKLIEDGKSYAAKCRARMVADTKRLIQTIRKDVSFLYIALQEIQDIKARRLRMVEFIRRERKASANMNEKMNLEFVPDRINNT